jgi:N-acetylmuramoyl-L-alanine amidase
MLRNAYWIVTAVLLAALVGCQDQKRVVVQLPPAEKPTPAPRVQPPKPKPPPLSALRPPTGGLPPLNGRVAVIDAGHGGKDPGTKGVSRLPEKSIVLSIALEIGRLLKHRRATVINTRTTDKFVELDARAAVAQRNRAHLFVAIHADSAARRSASGSTIYIARGASSQSYSAARSIQRALTAAGIACRGIHRANFRVLVAHSRPAVLVECGFLTNSSDASKLNTQQYISKMAAAIARGVADYLAANRVSG